MDPSLWRRLEPILDRALDLTGTARSAYLEGACAGDPELRSRLEALLAADGADGGALEAPARTRTLAPGDEELRRLVGELRGRRSRATAGSDGTTPALALSESHGRFLPGTIVAGRYRIVARVGRGGMGEVYRADDIRLGQPVALKFLPEEVERDARHRERLLSEVRHARQIAHPNVCRVFDVGEADGRLFLSMEFVDGEDLAVLLRRIGRLPREKAVDIAQQICAGLKAAHDLGIVHRDLKPANVMLDGRGRARITDFGLAVATEAAQERLGEGTPAYMAPEQLEGKEATARSDVYALGLVLYELFTGKRVFEAASPADLRRLQLTSEPQSPSSHVDGIDAAVDRAILRCLDKDPARRPASAGQVLAMLPGGDPLAAAVAAGETPSPEMVAAGGQEGALSPARATALFAGVLVALALAFALGVKSRELDAIPAMRSPESMRDRARDILKTLGREGAGGHDAWWVDLDPGFVRQAQEQPELPPLAKAHPSVLRFHLRESPKRLAPAIGRISSTDPPLYWSGEASVGLDPEGRLLEFAIVPPQIESGAPAGGEPDWGPVLALAAAAPGTLREAAPRWTPDVPCDSRRAWEGEDHGAPLRIEAASWRGRPIWMRTIAPWDRPERDTGDDPRVGPGIVMSAAVVIMLAVFALLARHNLRLGRENRRGALRVALAVYAGFALGIFLEHFPLTVDPRETWFFLERWATIPAFAGLCAWLYYLGVEPFLRRRWPHRLIAWTRLLEGRWLDPMVGKEALLGILAGLGIALLNALEPILGSLSGFDVMTGRLRLGPATEFWGEIGNSLAASFITGLGGYAALLILRAVLRRETPAWIACGLLIMAAFVSPAPPGLRWATIAVSATITVFALRVGLVAISLAWAVPTLLVNVPLTFDPGRWYAWRGMVVVALIAAAAVAAFRAALGPRRLIGALAMET